MITFTTDHALNLQMSWNPFLKMTLILSEIIKNTLLATIIALF